MHTITHTFALTALAAALLTVYSAHATDDEEYAVDLIPLTTAESNFSLGLGHYSGEREQFGMFDGQQDDDSILLLDGNVLMRDNDTGTWITATGRNLGMDDREATFGYEVQGDYGLKLLYNKLPRFAPYTANTGLSGIGTELAIIADPGTPSGTGTDLRIGTERETVGLEMFKYIMPGLNFKVNFKNEKKEGTRHWGRGGEPEFMLEPVDWTTRQLEMTLNYADKDFQISGGYYGSTFSNANTLVDSIYASDYPSTSLGDHIYLSLPLDNQAHQFFVDGGYNFTPTTRGTFKVSYTRATQDEHIPTADIAGLSWAGDASYPAAPSSLDGEVNTTLVQLGLTARPFQNLNLVANLRYHDVDDQTPEHLIINSVSTTASGSRYNGFERTLVHGTPLSYETLSGKLEATYRLPDNYSLIGGIDYKAQDRTVPYGSDVAGGTQTPTVGDDQPDGFDDQRYVPFRAELDETTYRVQVRRGLSETLNGSIAFLHSKRDGSSFSDAVHSEPGEGTHSDAIDPINIADRDRNKVRLTLDWLPVELVNLQVNYEKSKDDYNGHTYGLREGKAELISIDASVDLGKDWLLTGWISHDTNEAEQENYRFESGSYYEARMYDSLKDTGDSIGLKLIGRVSSKLTLGADLEWTRVRSEFGQDLVAVGTPASGDTLYENNTTGPLPDIKSTAKSLRLFAEYALRKNADLRVDLVHERWNTDDWTWQFSDGSPFIYGSPEDGTTIYTDDSQSATFIGIRYIFKFR